MTEHEPLILAVTDTVVPLACSVRALETAVREYLAITNEAPKPFVWTKTADEILANVARVCQRISNPGH